MHVFHYKYIFLEPMEHKKSIEKLFVTFTIEMFISFTQFPVSF